VRADRMRWSDKATDNNSCPLHSITHDNKFHGLSCDITQVDLYELDLKLIQIFNKISPTPHMRLVCYHCMAFLCLATLPKYQKQMPDGKLEETTRMPFY